jgi:hypothetical protein
MTSTDIQIIGRLFDFLSAYRPEELSMAASSSLITENIREALLALARARAENSVKIHSAAAPRANGSAGRQLRLLESQFFDVLTDINSIKSNAHLLDILSRAGVRLTTTSKDSRARILSQLRRNLDHLPPSRREDLMKEILRMVRPNQTEGWFKVIRGE